MDTKLLFSGFIKRGFDMTTSTVINVARQKLRIVLMARDVELRIVSLIIRAREGAEDVVLLDLGSNDSTVEYAQEVDCEVLHFNDEVNSHNIASYIINSNLESFDSTLILSITDEWRLRDLPLSINRAREGWDIHLSHQVDEIKNSNHDDFVLSEVHLQHIVLSRDGMKSIAEMSTQSLISELDESLRVRIVQAPKSVKIPQRESLATASRFAQLFYWMLETKHPLLLFGIPGTVLFILGYRLSGNVVGALEELNSTSIGVTLATIAMTLIGLFGIMVALILYIMGKQVEQIQSQYNWPSRE
tara:strand:+ start:502 stop:1407 length:906 start_codon:yes stop_codon:yes gene_type:complete